ncbi:MAG: 50S ribosomal protein L24 [Bacilli bacterium]|jgi:large subunit ribosomal protein L24
MIIRKGDKVVVITGRDKGKEGIVQKVHPKLEKVVVEGVNIRKKHRKPTQQNPEGSIIEVYAPIHVSNVALIDPKTKKPTRVGYRIEKGKKVRYAKRSGEVIK